MWLVVYNAHLDTLLIAQDRPFRKNRLREISIVSSRTCQFFTRGRYLSGKWIIICNF